MDHVDGELGHLLWSSSDSDKGPTDVGERLARLDGKIARTDKVASGVVRRLTRDEDESAARGRDDLRVRGRCALIVRVDELERLDEAPCEPW